MARDELEDALDPALAAPAADRVGQRRGDLVEALGGGRDGQPHLLDLVVVLDQPQLGQEAGQLEIGRKLLHRFGFG